MDEEREQERNTKLGEEKNTRTAASTVEMDPFVVEEPYQYVIEFKRPAPKRGRLPFLSFAIQWEKYSPIECDD